ncbi:MAG: DNA translocase FtsK 4TM domain-containing protein [Mailhella sp.]|nr:DNA translocase FtsK 4TM domain-containing protein [Mailhella sp.]
MYGHRLIRELLGLLFIFCGLLLLLSLWSYSAADPSFNQAVTIDPSAIQNSAGLFGAYLSGIFADVFGIASYLWVVLFLSLGAGLVARWLVIKWYRWIGYTMLFACLLTASSVWNFGFHGIEGGGLAGQWLSSISYLLFRSLGSLLVWTFIFLAGTELAFSISWLTLISGAIWWISSRFSKGDTEESEDAPKKKIFPSLAELISRRKKKEEDFEERPVLDIMLEEKSAEATESENLPALSLPLSEEIAAQNGEEALSSLSLDASSAPLTLQEDTVSSSAENSNEADTLFDIVEPSPVSNTDEIIDLQKTVEDTPDTTPAIPEAAASESSPIISEESVDIVLEASDIAVPAPVMPEVASFGSALESALEEPLPALLPSPERDMDTPFPHDEAYASVDSAVALAMQEQKEIEAASQPGEMEETPEISLLDFILPKRRQLSLPPMDLLAPLPEEEMQSRPDPVLLTQQGDALITCLKNFNVNATLARITPGPVVTMFEVRPAPGVKATRITNLANDLAMSLKAVAVRMQAPVPGTDTVGVEVPNERRSTVHYREIVENDGFRQAKSLLTIALGKDTGGRPVSADLAKMPHLLVAGATGAGKSVCLNAIILSLLYRARPDEVQMILVDPKQVELSMYADLPHLVHPVVTDMDITKNALLWAIDEMNRRLKVFSTVKVRNITGYNERQARLRAQVEEGGPVPLDENGQPEDLANMPFLVIIVDELADLMMVKRKEVEGSIVRLAQLARAAGIHLIIATQRPSVDVVTGLIKANFPCRIAFKVTSGQDSRTILDLTGAEKLLGMGDMLFKPNGGSIQRLHGAFVSDEEVASVVEFWKKQQKPNYQVDFSEFGEEEDAGSDDFDMPTSRGGDLADDPIYLEAMQFVMENGKVSISLLQRRFRIGFNRAARFVEQMEKDGILGQADGTKPRIVNR